MVDVGAPVITNDPASKSAHVVGLPPHLAGRLWLLAVVAIANASPTVEAPGWQYVGGVRASTSGTGPLLYVYARASVGDEGPTVAYTTNNSCATGAMVFPVDGTPADPADNGTPGLLAAIIDGGPTAQTGGTATAMLLPNDGVETTLPGSAVLHLAAQGQNATADTMLAWPAVHAVTQARLYDRTSSTVEVLAGHGQHVRAVPGPTGPLDVTSSASARWGTLTLGLRGLTVEEPPAEVSPFSEVVGGVERPLDVAGVVLAGELAEVEVAWP